MSDDRPILVRPATVADRGVLGRLLAAQLQEQGLAVDDDAVARTIELALAPQGIAWLVVAQRLGLVVGLLLANPIVSLGHGGSALRLEELFVASQHRRRGVARALVEQIAAEARLHGMGALATEADEGGPGGACLAALGFRPLRRRRFIRGLGIGNRPAVDATTGA